MTDPSGNFPDAFGMPPQRGFYGKRPTLTGLQRDEIRRKFAEARDETPGITVAEFARQVCDDYGTTVGAIRRTVS